MENNIKEQEEKELRILIHNRKINFVDFFKSLGLSKSKRKQFMLWYWENIANFRLLEGLDEFKKLKK